MHLKIARFVSICIIMPILLKFILPKFSSYATLPLDALSGGGQDEFKPRLHIYGTGYVLVQTSLRIIHYLSSEM